MRAKKLISLYFMLVVMFSTYEHVMSSSWDFAVTTYSKIIFYNSTWDEVTTAAHKFEELSAIAFDDTEEIIYFNDLLHNNGTIFSLKLSNTGGYHSIEKILEKTKNESVQGIAFDPLERTLYWTDAKNRHIYQMPIASLAEKNQQSNITVQQQQQQQKQQPPEIWLATKNNEIPQGIAVDACRRKIYWTNTDYRNPTIERVSMDGSQREVIIRTNLFMPSGIIVDQFTKRIYWVDDLQGSFFSVESADLDGQNRKTIVKGLNNAPLNLAVDQNSVYWTDLTNYAIWKVSKVKENDKQEIVKSFDYSPIGIVSRTNLLSTQSDNPECDAVVAQIRKSIPLISTEYKQQQQQQQQQPQQSKKPTIKPSGVLIIDNCESVRENKSMNNDKVGSLTHKTAVVVSGTDDNKNNNKSAELVPMIQFCLNFGEFNKQTGACICSKEYKGVHCEIPTCYNYCLYGECHVSSTGYPKCSKCNEGYKGDRCEQNICTDYCLNDGHCDIEDNIAICQCKHSYHGQRCERLDEDQMCRRYCEYGIQVEGFDMKDMCTDCSKFNESNESVSSSNLLVENHESHHNQQQQQQQHQEQHGEAYRCSLTSSNDLMNKTIIFVCIGVVLSLCLIYLIVITIRRVYKPIRPKIKKTYVVHKNVNPTPLTCRPTGTAQCEVTIEDCCNMNICDTPCFDPKTIQQEINKENRRKEDKYNLLTNMEGDLY